MVKYLFAHYKGGNNMAILYCDGLRFRKAFLAGASWLNEYEVILNHLNVFPKPDGDTGTNMALTLLSAVHELRDMEDAALEEVMEAAARGILLGARGSSGIILSQIIAGFAEVGRGKAKLNSQDIAAGFRLGSERAYRAVVEPVEGTLLTAVRESSEEAVEFAKDNDDIIQLLEVTLDRAKMSLKNSPNLLPILAQAGVVDAGSQGFVYILEGILRLVRYGHVLSSYERPDVSPSLPTIRAQTPESWDNPYCTEFLLTGTSADVSVMRENFARLGSDLAVVGWDELVRVHIHTNDPEKVLACAHSYGEPLGVKIDDTRKQYRSAMRPATKT